MQRIASCTCGQLNARCLGEPVRISVCHCLECQRRTGSAFGVQATYREADVTLTGSPSSYTRHGDEGHWVTTYFCSTCGSTAWYRIEQRPGMVSVPVAGAGFVALFSSRLSEAIRIPAPALFLIAAAIASDLVPSLGTVTPENVQRIVTVALIFVLFDGGMQIGRKRFRAARGVIASVGIAGTFLTAGALALLAHYALGFGWTAALLSGPRWRRRIRRWSSPYSASAR